MESQIPLGRRQPLQRMRKPSNNLHRPIHSNTANMDRNPNPRSILDQTHFRSKPRMVHNRRRMDVINRQRRPMLQPIQPSTSRSARPLENRNRNGRPHRRRIRSHSLQFVSAIQKTAGSANVQYAGQTYTFHVVDPVALIESLKR